MKPERIQTLVANVGKEPLVARLGNGRRRRLPTGSLVPLSGTDARTLAAGSLPIWLCRAVEKGQAAPKGATTLDHEGNTYLVLDPQTRAAFAAQQSPAQKGAKK